MGVIWVYIERFSKQIEYPHKFVGNIEDLFRFTYIESFFVPVNLFPFWSLNLFLEFSTFLIFESNVNMSAGNLGLFKKNGIYFVRSRVRWEVIWV